MSHSTPKAQFTNIMIEILGMVENICDKYPVESQEYIDICNQFKNANLKFEDLMKKVNELKENTYYNNYIVNPNTKNSTILTDDQKSNNNSFVLCQCGCYVNKSHLARHKKTDKHYKLIRNKKLTLKKQSTNISPEISKEVKLSALMLKKQHIISNTE